MKRLIVYWGIVGMGLAACNTLDDGMNEIGAEVFTDSMSGNVSGTLDVSPVDIPCDGATNVTVTIVGESGIAGQPVDIMLVLDRSGSMGGDMGALKAATKSFVDMIDEGTDGVRDGVIANGSRIGVVSFATNATLDRQLTSNANQVKSAIDGLVASGLTNHAAAIDLAQAQFAGSPNNRLMIIFTDGFTNTGGNPLDSASIAKDAGTEIFGIGLGSVNESTIRSWVSPPVEDHAFFTTDSSTLQRIFDAIGVTITTPAATGATLSLDVDSRFTISGASASKGTASASESGIHWSIGDIQTETVTLSYTATHDNLTSGGVVQLHTSLSYSDNEGNVIVFSNPTVNVRGCAAVLELTPKLDTHIVGEEHMVIATVRDDFGDPVSGVVVDLSVAGGPSIVDGDPSAPVPSMGSGITDANGQVPFIYTNSQASTDTITAIADVQPNVAEVLSDTAQCIWRPIPVIIDIKPGSDPSSFGAHSKGNIPVALFGAPDFDVTRVDDSTVRFGDAPSTQGDAAPVRGRGHIEEKNGDGIWDKVYHFYFPDTNLDPGDTEGCLSGEIDGLDFMGCSDVNIVPNK